MSTAEPAQAAEEDRPPSWILWPTGHRAMQTIYDQLADPKCRPSLLLKETVAAGYLGRKPGRSVYRC
jgi:hypothetical protein